MTTGSNEEMLKYHMWHRVFSTVSVRTLQDDHCGFPSQFTSSVQSNASPRCVGAAIHYNYRAPWFSMIQRNRELNMEAVTAH